MKSLLVSKLLYDEVKKELAKSFDLIELEENVKLDKPVSTHPDMQLFKIDNEVILTKSLYLSNKKLSYVLNSKYNVSFTLNEHSPTYPGDIILNVLKLGSYLFCKSYSVDKRVVELAKSKNMMLVNINQGYSACSTLALEDAVISADKGICEAVSNKEYDVLQISSGAIVLEGYDYGFIGGASFFDKDNSKVYFFGDIKSHPDYESIVSFLRRHSVDYVSFDRLPLTDFGGAIIL